MTRYIQTYTGRKIHFDRPPTPDEIDPRDIVQALSNQCRFNGHGRFYSVAQHSVIVSENVTPALRLGALLHDAHEAYVGDIVQPLKNTLQYTVLDLVTDKQVEHDPVEEISRRFDVAIAVRFGLSVEDFYDARVRAADKRALATERRDVMFPSDVPWHLDVEPFPQAIEPVYPDEARAMFVSALRYCGVNV